MIMCMVIGSFVRYKPFVIDEALLVICMLLVFVAGL